MELKLSPGPTLSPGLERQIREIVGDNHHQVDAPLGGIIRANKTWQNIGAAGTRDIMAAYGTGETLEAFLMEFGAVLVGQHCATGAEVTAVVDCAVPVAAALGLRNALVGVGIFDAETSTMYFDDYGIVVSAIDVTTPTVPRGVQVSVSFVAL